NVERNRALRRLAAAAPERAFCIGRQHRISFATSPYVLPRSLAPARSILPRGGVSGQRSPHRGVGEALPLLDCPCDSSGEKRGTEVPALTPGGRPRELVLGGAVVAVGQCQVDCRDNR